MDSSLAQTGFTVLHSFTGGPSDGQRPEGSLIQSGSNLVGMTSGGGSTNNGSLFRISPDGTGYSVLHFFAGGSSDGSQPPFFGTPLQSGSVFYGVTNSGGSANLGAVFRMNSDGTGTNVLHAFVGGSDGRGPQGSLVQSGTTLYGTTTFGGSADDGTIFRINTDGSGYSILHAFSGGSTDGSHPQDSLVQSGSFLYGMTRSGGAFGFGTIFRVGTDGSGYSVLRSFSDNATDGGSPWGSLIASGSTLYGMTFGGGAFHFGTVFRMEADGSGFNLLHSFEHTSTNGSFAFGTPMLSGSRLYGMTQGGGTSDLGTIFQIDTDGTDFEVIHSFSAGASDGSLPYGTLYQSGSTLYGTTYGGGSSNLGTIFSLVLPEPSSLVLGSLGLLAVAGWVLSQKGAARIGVGASDKDRRLSAVAPDLSRRSLRHDLRSHRHPRAISG